MKQEQVQYDTHTQKVTRILHVEDNRVDAIIIHNMLERNGKYPFSFTAAETLQAALEKLKKGFYDIVLLDLTLPDSRGLSTLETVHQEYPELPIIILTGSDDESTGIDAIRLGAQDYLIKGHLKAEIILRMIFSSIDRKKAEQSLIMRHERIELATLGTSDGFWDWQITEKKMYFSDRFYHLVEHTEESLPATFDGMLNLVHIDHRQIFSVAIQSQRNDAIPLRIECRLQMRSGKYRWFLVRGRAAHDNGKIADRISGSIVDIDDRKTAEEALKQSEQRLKFALEGSSDGFWDWNIKTGVLYFSPRFESMLEYETGALMPHMGTWQKMIHADDIEETLNKLNDHLEGKTLLFQATHRMKTKSGKWLWTSGRGKAVEWDSDNNPIRVVGAYTDITQEKAAAENNARLALQLQQASKLESIGRLAAGIAHEINTPTQFVGDNIWFLQEECRKLLPILEETIEFIHTIQKNDENSEKLIALEKTWIAADLQYLSSEVPMSIEQSLEGIQRIGSIVKALKEFSHPGSSHKETTDINKIIENTIIVSRNEWKFIAELRSNLEPSLPHIECYPGELNQTLLNLIINAAQSIESKNASNDVALGLISITTEQLDQYIIIKIKDTGIGIPAEIQGKIFEPFFTTKEMGKGTGQGLAIAHSVIVDRHKGKIDIDSQPNEGTTFTIALPISLTDTHTEKSNETIRTLCR